MKTSSMESRVPFVVRVKHWDSHAVITIETRCRTEWIECTIDESVEAAKRIADVLIAFVSGTGETTKEDP